MDSNTEQPKPEAKKVVKHNRNVSRKLLAFTMRFDGHSYKEIEQETGYTVYTLEAYFYKGGRWYEEYQTWAQARVADINDQVGRMFSAQALEAMQQITNISRGYCTVMIVGADGTKQRIPITVKDSVILTAAQDILNRAGFKPTEKVEVDTPEDKAEQITRWFEEQAKKKAEAQPVESKEA